MIRIYSKDEALEMDLKANLKFGMSSEKLIERASFELAKKFNKIFIRLKKKSTIVFFIGPGNNGKDGLGMSHWLDKMGFHCELFFFYKETSQNFYSAKSVLNEIQKLQKKRPVIVVDSIFGVGLSRALPAHLQELFELLNKKRNIIIVSIDIPSGIDANTGLILGSALKSNFTFTISKPKLGLLLNDGGQYSGKISTIDIGLPIEIEKEFKRPPTFLFTKKEAIKLLPRSRSALMNKSKLGHLWIFSGSEGMGGALQLTTEAAARMGVGYVSFSTLLSTETTNVLPDFLNRPWPEKTLNLKGISGIVVGPGLGSSTQVQKLIHELKLLSKQENLLEVGYNSLNLNPLPVLLDADGLNALKDSDQLPSHWIITPHAGELSRLLKVPSSEIEANRIHFANFASLKFGCIVVLKGFRTVVANNKKQVIIYSGHPVLAKAGTGDVLSGFIGGLLAQGIPPFKAACLGAYLHGALGSRYVKKYKNDFTLLASDLKNLLPDLIRELRGLRYDR